MSTVDRQVAALAEALCDNSSDAADLAAMLQITVDEFFGRAERDERQTELEGL